MGLAVCILGLVIAALSLLPGGSPGAFPWPLFAGTMIYFPGALMIAYFARGEKGKQTLSLLRFIRLGFAGLMLVIVMKMVG